MSINGTVKKRGRPATGLGVSINVRLQPEQLTALDDWIDLREPRPSRPEAIRLIVRERLSTAGLLDEAQARGCDGATGALDLKVRQRI